MKREWLLADLSRKRKADLHALVDQIPNRYRDYALELMRARRLYWDAQQATDAAEADIATPLVDRPLSAREINAWLRTLPPPALI